jgi:hypothetical protein
LVRNDAGGDTDRGGDIVQVGAQLFDQGLLAAGSRQQTTVGGEGTEEPQLPRVGLVFRLWQCDKKDQDWREGPPLTVPAKVSICRPGLHPPVKSVSNENKNTAFCCGMPARTQNIGRYKRTYGEESAAREQVGLAMSQI